MLEIWFNFLIFRKFTVLSGNWDLLLSFQGHRAWIFPFSWSFQLDLRKFSYIENWLSRSSLLICLHLNYKLQVPLELSLTCWVQHFFLYLSIQELVLYYSPSEDTFPSGIMQERSNYQDLKFYLSLFSVWYNVLLAESFELCPIPQLNFFLCWSSALFPWVSSNWQ